MATNFSPCKGSYVLNQFPSNVMFGMNGFHVSASGAIQGHHGPLVFPNFSLVPKLKPLQKTQLYNTNEEPLSVPYIHNNNFFFSHKYIDIQIC